MQGLDVHSGANGIVTKYSHQDDPIPKERRELNQCAPLSKAAMHMYAYTKVGKGSNSSCIDIPEDKNVIG